METGKEEPYKRDAMKKTAKINGEEVEVVYKMVNGIIRISNAWIK